MKILYTLGGTATLGQDFILGGTGILPVISSEDLPVISSFGEINIKGGETQVILNLSVINDNLKEIKESITNNINSYPVTITVTDQGGLTVETQFNLTVINVNDRPQLTQIANQTAIEDQQFTFNISSNFSDPDSDTLTFTQTGLPTNLTLENGVISGIPTNNNVGTYNITITAIHSSNLSISDTFTLEILNVNDRPEVTQFANKTAIKYQQFTLNISSKFSDPDPNDTLKFSAIGLPNGFKISENGVITGRSTNNNVGNYNIIITATNSSNLSISDTFNLAISNVNFKPQLVQLLAKQSLISGDTFTLDVTKNFTDQDVIHGDRLTFTATNLPTGFTITENGLITGVTTDEMIGQRTVVVTATDTGNMSTQVGFFLEVLDQQIVEPDTDKPFGGLGDDNLAPENLKAVFSGGGNDQINLVMNDSPNRERFFGGSGDDQFHIGTNDKVYGGEGHDIFDLKQSQGGNYVYGDGSNDQFYLGTEDDLLMGGLGQDTFIFTVIPVTETSNIIADFDPENDLIDLSSLNNETISIKAGSMGAELITN